MTKEVVKNSIAIEVDRSEGEKEFEEMAADYPSFEDFMRESVQSGRLLEMLEEWKLRAIGVARDVQRLRRVRKS